MLGASIGKKIFVAVTGCVAVLYIIAHMLGNLQMYAGPDAINQYGANLKAMGPLLWIGRIGLLLFFVTHIWLGIQTKLENRTARAGGYQHEGTVKATLSSRFMIFSGLIILVFFVYHILHFTAHITDPAYANLRDAAGRFDVYSMVIAGFSNTPIAVFYVIAMLLLGSHISHGIYSMFQTMGWNSPRFEKRLRAISWTITIIVIAGFIAVPLGVMTGILKESQHAVAQMNGILQ